MTDKNKSKWTWQKEIDATHPMEDGAGDDVFEADTLAMQLVGERHEKHDLVDLVRYLLLQRNRRSTISLETAQELADCLKMYLCQCECCAGKLDSREREALSRFNAEKGGQGE